HIDGSPYSTSRGCRRYLASRRIISSSTARHPKSCAISMAWHASTKELPIGHSATRPRRTLIRLLLAAAFPVGGPPCATRNGAQHPKGLRFLPGSRPLEPGCRQPAPQQFANRRRAARHPAMEPEIVNRLQFIRTEHDLKPLWSHEVFRHGAPLAAAPAYSFI